jgi:hypothetical protein
VEGGGGGAKIPGIVKKIYLKYLYKFETLVPFEVLPLRLDAAIPAPLPMLETLSKIVVLFYVLFVLYRSMYCLCVNVYCTSATG